MHSPQNSSKTLKNRQPRITKIIYFTYYEIMKFLKIIHECRNSSIFPTFTNQ